MKTVHLASLVCCCLLSFGLQGLTPQESSAISPAEDSQKTVNAGLQLMRPGLDQNLCTLTFDDGPSKFTSELLDILSDYQIPATFFVIGRQVERRPELIRRMIADGHEVGNHSYSHNTLRKQLPEEQEEDLRKMDELLRELGVAPRFVRPPYGFYDHNTVNAVQSLDGQIVLWSVDSQDWRKLDELEGVLSNMQTLYTGAPLRGVFLFHDTHRRTVDNMPRILDALLATGCHFVSLSAYIDATQPRTGLPPEPNAKQPHDFSPQALPGTPTKSAVPEVFNRKELAISQALGELEDKILAEHAEQQTEAARSQTSTPGGVPLQRMETSPGMTGATRPSTMPETTGVSGPDTAPVLDPPQQEKAKTTFWKWLFGESAKKPEKSNSLPH